jgi:CheY-like chemotaxis protein/HPt (histidine-containing phosphotransfer) domain-containing protein
MPIKHPAAPSSVDSLANERLRILLVDDSEDIRAVVCAYLTAFPHWEIDIAVNGLQAIGKCRQRAYDVVFMDMQMPLMDGYAATERIRLLEHEAKRRHVPIIALTADGGAAEVARGLQAGCTAHLLKPVRKPALLGAIARYATTGVNVPIETAGARDVAAAGSADGEVVHLDRDVAELIPGFLENRQRDVLKLRAAARAGDLATVSCIGHTLKGDGASYGFERIAELGGQLESAATAGQTAVHATIAELADYIAGVRVLFDR